MENIHSDSGEVLIKISPLIDFRGANNGRSKIKLQKKPLHTEMHEVKNKKAQIELSPIHDFMTKLMQPSVIHHLKDYVNWQASWRKQYRNGTGLEQALMEIPNYAPLSINLDLTTACNYRCDHCVDMDILNKGITYEHEKLKDSLTNLIDRGLRTVILIGGGEPTAYVRFEDIVKHLKDRNLKIGVVTNGSILKKIEAVAPLLTKGDWVRLSLDAGDNETFRAMHKPGNKKCTLDWICEHIPPIKKINSDFQIGFSFIIVWNDCVANNLKIIENIDEIVLAAERAKKYQFDYISFKPFLARVESNNAETVNLIKNENQLTSITAKIRSAVNQAKRLEDKSFKVIESTNLRVLENNTYMNFTDQPKNCHMQFFRQILSPLGIFNCPVYRHVPQALLGDKHAYATPEDMRETQKNTLRLIEAFDASKECKEVTCLYNHANWFIEDLINYPEKLNTLIPSEERQDYFL